ncbi:uncharacterized protein [Dysidea avara]|uniref:uncharacterized protein n=1 Tax=Dysidea avara TaxID=196820 RepID=UPI003321E7E6
MRMTRYMIAIAIVCLTNLVSSQQFSQACVDASGALANSVSCQTAFASIGTAGSDSPVCSGRCRRLIENVYDNCENLASGRDALEAACGGTTTVGDQDFESASNSTSRGGAGTVKGFGMIALLLATISAVLL